MQKPYVVGIAGGSASGKSTLCQQLESALEGRKVITFHMDDYFKPKNKRPYVAAPITNKMYLDDNHPTTINLPLLQQDLFAAVDEAKADIIIVEGLLTLYDDAICQMLDLKLYVECRPDERIVRRLRRNMARGLTFDEISDVYLDMVRYRHDQYVEHCKWKADLIINGSMFPQKGLDIIVREINYNLTRNS
ncbi:MAG: AAA family ATPase [Defluviitaleaceae bacterium]|nr:AAA family ATPase [Defluviitaleaceae bacterium]